MTSALLREANVDALFASDVATSKWRRVDLSD